MHSHGCHLRLGEWQLQEHSSALVLNCSFFPWPLSITHLSLSLLGCLVMLGHRAARAFGEYLSQNHPEGRNGSGKRTDVPWLCPCVPAPVVDSLKMKVHLFICHKQSEISAAERQEESPSRRKGSLVTQGLGGLWG